MKHLLDAFVAVLKLKRMPSATKSIHHKAFEQQQGDEDAVHAEH